MTQIILFRHGDKQKFSSSSNNSIGDKYNSLTPEGINQITRLGSTLKHRFPDLKNNPYIFSSPFTRSLQSAEIVRHILNIDQILVYPNLAEFYPTTDFTQAKDIRDHLYAQSMIDLIGCRHKVSKPLIRLSLSLNKLFLTLPPNFPNPLF